MATPILGMTEVVEAQASAEVPINQYAVVLEQLGAAKVLDRDLATPPGSPARGDLYIVAASPTGAWTGQAGKLALYNSGWYFYSAKGGMVVFVSDEKLWLGYSSVESLWHPLQESWSATEHWTGEYRDGSLVYAKTVDIGAMPNSTVKSVAHGISGGLLTKPWTFQASFYASGVLAAPIPFPGSGTPVACDIYADGTNVVVFSSYDLSAFSAKVRLTYCK